jgi:anti-sigma B factor antagonist
MAAAPPGAAAREELLSVTASDLPAEGQRDVSSDTGDAPFDDVITLSTSTGEDGAVTVTVVGEVDTFTAPVLRSSLDSQLEQSPRELVIDLSGVQFLGSAGLAVLVETQKSAKAKDVGLTLIATTRAVTRPLEVTGLIDLFTIADGTGSR